MDHAIGQHVIIGFEGTETTPELRSFIRDEGIGGVILFARNISSKSQIMRMTARLKEEACDVPLIVSIDQEGGAVQRLPRSCGTFPSMEEIGRRAKERDDPTEAYRAGQHIAEVLVPLGVNLDYAPVLDVNTNPFNPVIGDRSFGCDPRFVAELGVQFMKGLMEGGVLACGKHFPGHGDTDADSHLTLPLMSHTRRRFEACEWVPFRAAISAGVPSIMTAHLMAPNLDPNAPASLSEEIMTNILRGTLGFKGIIISDDLLMAGVADLMTPADAAVRALREGADYVLICRDMAVQRAAIDRLKRALDEGELSVQEMELSNVRIQQLKEKIPVTSL